MAAVPRPQPWRKTPLAVVGFGWDPSGCSTAICFAAMPQQHQKRSWQHQRILFREPGVVERGQSWHSREASPAQHWHICSYLQISTARAFLLPWSCQLWCALPVPLSGLKPAPNSHVQPLASALPAGNATKNQTERAGDSSLPAGNRDEVSPLQSASMGWGRGKQTPCRFERWEGPEGTGNST